MDESVQTTFEEASRCPKCGNPGEVRKKEPAPSMPRGTTVQHIYCVSTLCSWYDTPWIVQVNPDGSVPPPQLHIGPKTYQGFDRHDQMARDLIAALEAQVAAETSGGPTEIRNPYAR